MSARATYIDPASALGALTVTYGVDPDLGPSPPDHYDEPEEANEPRVALGIPPIIAARYSAVLERLCPMLDRPEDRTAARMLALLEEVSDAAEWIEAHADSLPPKVMTELDRAGVVAERVAYLRRLDDYRRELVDEEPDDYAGTRGVYVGLVCRREGAGPVPDVIMHLHLALQLGVPLDDVERMGEAFVERALVRLERADDFATREAMPESNARRRTVDALSQIWSTFARPLMFAGGLLAGIAVTAIGVAVATDRGGHTR